VLRGGFSIFLTDVRADKKQPFSLKRVWGSKEEHQQRRKVNASILFWAAQTPIMKYSARSRERKTTSKKKGRNVCYRDREAIQVF